MPGVQGSGGRGEESEQPPPSRLQPPADTLQKVGDLPVTASYNKTPGDR
jgi:hypothetical protein